MMLFVETREDSGSVGKTRVNGELKGLEISKFTRGIRESTTRDRMGELRGDGGYIEME